MRIEQIYFFQEVAATNSITLAAKNLMISQQGLSDNISKLEEEFGIQLFYRTKKGVSLTPEGQQFLQISFKMIDNYQEMMNIAQLNGQEQQTLCIATDPHIIEGHFEDLLRIYHRNAPSVQLSIRESSGTKNVFDMVLNKEANLGLSLCNSIDWENILSCIQKDYPEMECIKLHQSNLYALVNYASELSQKEEISITSLLSAPLVFNSEYFYQTLQHAFPQHLFNPFLITSKPNIVLQAILNHNAIGFCTKYTKSLYDSSQKAKPVKITEAVLFAIAIVPKELTQNKKITHFLNMFSRFLSSNDV